VVIDNALRGVTEMRIIWNRKSIAQPSPDLSEFMHIDGQSEGTRPCFPRNKLWNKMLRTEVNYHYRH
jgi:hypothetical protein